MKKLILYVTLGILSCAEISFGEENFDDFQKRAIDYNLEIAKLSLSKNPQEALKKCEEAIKYFEDEVLFKKVFLREKALLCCECESYEEALQVLNEIESDKEIAEWVLNFIKFKTECEKFLDVIKISSDVGKYWMVMSQIEDALEYANVTKLIPRFSKHKKDVIAGLLLLRGSAFQFLAQKYIEDEDAFAVFAFQRLGYNEFEKAKKITSDEVNIRKINDILERFKKANDYKKRK